jgi:hypothetical protein
MNDLLNILRFKIGKKCLFPELKKELKRHGIRYGYLKPSDRIAFLERILQEDATNKTAKQLPTAEEFISNHYGEIYDKRPEGFKSFISREKYIELHGLGKIYGVEKSNKDLLIEFAKMHIQACKEDIAGSIEYDQDKALHRQSVLQAYPDSNIR